ncbi:hypothetical protein [Weissella ceti]|uniref:Uncharacterized protein n=1 Tax=Weissella ceti TaxID=759620 RepID=A0A088GG53_9LACO|nr:hypothetical protein [Weissella ceti]AIM63088.1 hypothetical protein WS74_0836 [Weissella ceti]
MTNKVTHAPTAVIDELDKLKNTDMIYELFERGSVLDTNTLGDSNVVDSWVYGIEHELTLKRELAVINHVFNNERLQPEREPRYYVDATDKDGCSFYLASSGAWVVRGTYDPETISYDCGLDHETAVKAQALYGGTIKEIK